jgi:hypothetical protein
VQDQASFLGYMDAFWVLLLIALAMIPLALLLSKVKLGGAADMAEDDRPPRAEPRYAPEREAETRPPTTPHTQAQAAPEDRQKDRSSIRPHMQTE